MKKIFLFLTFSLLLFSFESFSQDKTAKDLYGKWMAIDNDEVAGTELHLFEGGKAIMIFDGKKKEVTYKVDFSKSPIWFDMTDTKNGKKHVTFGILRFLGNNKIEWEMMDYETRPVKFSENYGTTGFFERAK